MRIKNEYRTQDKWLKYTSQAESYHYAEILILYQWDIEDADMLFETEAKHHENLWDSYMNWRTDDEASQHWIRQ